MSVMHVTLNSRTPSVHLLNFNPISNPNLAPTRLDPGFKMLKGKTRNCKQHPLVSCYFIKVNRFGLLSHERMRDLSVMGLPTPMQRGDKASSGFVSPYRLGSDGTEKDGASVLSSKLTIRSFLEAAHSAVFLPVGECTLLMSVFNMANCLVGSGILGLPFGLKVGGWAGLIVMLLTTIITAYTGKVIGRCIEHLLVKYPGSGRDRFQDMAEMCCQNRLLGRAFKALMNLSIVLELWGSACSRIVLQGSNLNKVFPSYSTETFMITCTCVLLPTVFIGMEYLSYLSMVGLCTSLLLLIGILIAGSLRGISDDTELVHLEGLPMTFGIILFSYSGHAVFPQIYRSMQTKQEYGKAVDTAFYISFTFYALMAAGGYLFWGSTVLDQITLNLPSGIWADTLILLMVLNNMLSYPLIMSAPIEATEDVLGVTSLLNSHPWLFWIGSILLRSALVIGTLLVALCVTNFAVISTFIGAVFTISVSLIFPSIILLKLMYFNLPPHVRSSEGISLGEVFLNFFLIFLGFFGMVTGVMSVFNPVA